ncbi:MAG TPA: amidohydrolase family protein [Terracidiphilus sp.]|nr:amidohydrolase family protein [Terracidiphilus sp.]
MSPGTQLSHATIHFSNIAFMYRLFLGWIAGLFLLGAGAWPQAVPVPAPAPLALTGGTVVDVTDWGRSANDIVNAVVIVQNGKITDVGSAATVQIPKGARIIDCTGKFIIPGLVDGFVGMNSQGEADASLYMGVTTAVVSADSRRGHIDFSVHPSPHLYLIDSVGTTDDWSLLISHSDWTEKLRQDGRPAELSPEDTQAQLAETAKLGTKVVYLGHDLTAANTQSIISRAHQMGMVTYGEFVSTPYRVGIEAGVDALLHMGRYELGVIPDELQQPLVNDPEGPSAATAYDYSERLPITDVHVRRYANLIASHHAALMPTFANYYQRLPGHRNLWEEPAAKLLDPVRMFDPPDRKTGEMVYPLPSWSHHLPAMAQRYMEENLRKKADQSGMRLWRLNQAIFAAFPHYLAASGAPATGSFTGISMHVEMEMLVRLGLTPREALAAATNNYSLQFHWNELGLIAPGRRADILVIDGDPAVNIWNARRISTLIFEGNVMDRDALLRKP